MKSSDDRLDRIEDKLDRINDKIANIDVTLAKQSVILDEHIKRSNMLEEKMKPVEKHVAIINTIFKILGGTSLAGGLGHAIMKILKVY
jgi:archaellum component FlaC